MQFELKAEGLLAFVNSTTCAKIFGKFTTKDWEKCIFSQQSIDGITYAEIARFFLGIIHSKKKFPPLGKEPFLYLPPPEKLNAAQSSSISTAKIKSEISSKYNRIIDLCGGYGVDAYYMHNNRKLIHIEPNERLHVTAKFNFRHLKNIECINSTAEEFLETWEALKGDLLYADPSRIDEKRQIITDLKNYLPDIRPLPHMCAKSNTHLLLKLSPMLDINLLQMEWSAFEFDIHLVSVNNELKDLLLHFHNSDESKTHVHHIMGEEHSSFIIKNSLYIEPEPLPSFTYVYDPNPAFKKLRNHSFLAQTYGLNQYGGFLISNEYHNNFPGKTFKVLETLELDKSIKKRIQKGKYSVVSRHPQLVAKDIETRYKLVPSTTDFLLFFEHENKASVCIAERLD